MSVRQILRLVLIISLPDSSRCPCFRQHNMDEAEKIVNKTLNEINDEINNNLNMKKEEREKNLEANQWKLSYIDSISQQLKEILSF